MSQLTTQEDFTQSMNPYASRRLPFLRRNIRKFFARGAYARTRTMQTARTRTDSRQLGTIIRSQRSANPYQIQPSAGRSVSFWRKTEINLTLNQSTGWGGLGSNSLNWGFSLGYIYGYLGGSMTYVPPVPNASDFQALFDYYKINAVKMQMFFSKNTSDIVNAGTAMPVVLIANDFDDVAENMTSALMLQRVGCRHVQFDSNNVNGINHYVKPRPTGVVVQTDPATGVLTSANAGIPMGATWLDTAQSNIVHCGIKCLFDSQGLTTATTLGVVTFIFDVEYVFKGYR